MIPEATHLIPEPTAEDLERDAEFDLAPWSDGAEKEDVLAVMRAWIRRAVAAERYVRSISTMLGWLNVPPQSSIENDLREIMARVKVAERDRDELRAESERLKSEIVGHKKANDLLLKGMESQAELMDGMKQELRTKK